MFAFATLASGCAQDSGFGRADSDSEPGVKHVEMSIDIAIQRSEWVLNVVRCHLQAALRTFEPQDNDMVPFVESGQSICSAHDAQHLRIVAPETGPRIAPGSGRQLAIAGEDVAADIIELHSDEQTITLEQIDWKAMRLDMNGWIAKNHSVRSGFDLEMEDDPGPSAAGEVAAGARCGVFGHGGESVFS